MSETDAAGLVHFSHFLRWAEDAEGDFFRKNGLTVFGKTAAGTRLGFPRVSVGADFRAPARYADRIRVRIRPRAFPRPEARSIEWQFEILRVEDGGAGTTLLAAGTWTSVFAEISADGKTVSARALPDDVVAAVKKLFSVNGES